eukprot:scaffold5312_cov118-Isochrysis_galbana.AAC.10
MVAQNPVAKPAKKRVVNELLARASPSTTSRTLRSQMGNLRQQGRGTRMVSRRGSEARPCRRGRRCRREHRHAARTTRDSSAAALRLSIIAAMGRWGPMRRPSLRLDQTMLECGMLRKIPAVEPRKRPSTPPSCSVRCSTTLYGTGSIGPT